MKNKNDLLIGFLHGVCHKFINPFSLENINNLKNSKINAIEIHLHSYKDLDQLEVITESIKGFKYKSIHLPCDLRYQNDDLNHDFLKKVQDYYLSINADLVVVHPDIVSDFSIFDKYNLMIKAVENMDNKKASFKYLEDFKIFFEKHKNWNLVLDLNHSYSNDPSMDSAKAFIVIFQDKIKQFHISGFEYLHEPLFKTQQLEIINCAQIIDKPIIIESEFEVSDGAEAVLKEFNFILNSLN